jgi:hypothetical protein
VKSTLCLAPGFNNIKEEGGKRNRIVVGGDSPQQGTDNPWEA